MITHPLLPTIMEIDDKLNEFIKIQKGLHLASLSGMTTKKQDEQIKEVDKKISDLVNNRNIIQEKIFADTHLVILHDWEWDLKDPPFFFF